MFDTGDSLQCGNFFFNCMSIYMFMEWPFSIILILLAKGLPHTTNFGGDGQFLIISVLLFTFESLGN